MSARSVKRRETARKYGFDTTGLALEDMLANLMAERDWHAVAVAESHAHGYGNTSDYLWEQTKLEAAITTLAPTQASVLERIWADRDDELFHLAGHPHMECPTCCVNADTFWPPSTETPMVSHFGQVDQ